MDVLARASARIVRADRNAMQALGKEEDIAQELLFTDKAHLHAIVILPKNPMFYICTGFSRKQGNLSLARRVSQEMLANLVITI